MKNYFYFLVIAAISFSCTTKQERLIKDAENYIKDSIITTINDPDSYIPVSTKIINVTSFDHLTKLDIALLKMCVESLKELNYLDSLTVLNNKDKYTFEKYKNIKSYKCTNLLDSAQLYQKTIDTNNIAVVIKHIFRNKNIYGALQLDTITLRYFENDLFYFNNDPSERFFKKGFTKI